MVWFSLPFCIITLLYLTFSTSIVYQYGAWVTAFTLVYAGINIFAAITIKRKPVSHWRILGLISLNISIILSILVAEHDINNIIYIAFFAILLTSAGWFGLGYLIACFIMMLMGQLMVAALIGISDASLFIIHILSLSIAPIIAIIMHKQSQPASLLHKNFLALMDQSPIPIFTYHLIDQVPIIRFANTKVCQTFANKQDTLISTPAHHIAIAEDADELKLSCRNALLDTQHTKKHTFFIRSHNKQGDVIKTMCIASHLMWQGEHIGICFLLDITQNEQQRDELQHSMHQGYMSTLVAGIVHDFRNVLTNIIGSAEVLEFTLTDKTSKKQLQRIIQSGEQGSESITHLLQLSSASKQNERNQTLDIQNIFQNVISLLRIQLPDHIQLDCTLDADLPHIKFSLSQLEQILVNLVNNAKQAITNHGKISIQVTTHSVQPNQHETLSSLKISITDNGCGIKDKDLPFITKSFWTSRKEAGGTGLGLAMVKRIVAQHHGKLEITSTIGIGTTVDVYLPEHRTDKGAEKEAIVKKKEKSKSCKPCSILLVDDSLEIIEVYRMLLETMGHQVFDAVSAEQAIEVHNKNTIDLLITDLKMPNMDGIELTMSLRKEQPFLPVLMITAYDKIKKDMPLQDMNIALLLKPGTFNKLNQAIVEIQSKNPNLFS